MSFTLEPKKLISDAYKIIGIFSEDEELPEFRMTEGLQKLNLILSKLSLTPYNILYKEDFTFPLEGDKQEYIISLKAGSDVIHQPFVDLFYCYLVEENLNYYVKIMTQKNYIESGYINNDEGRPFYLYYQNGVNGSSPFSKIVFFTAPTATYDCTITAKFIIDKILIENITKPVESFAPEYFDYLIFSLAHRLSFVYPSALWDNDRSKQLIKLEKEVFQSSDKDLSIRRESFNTGWQGGDFYGGC